MDAYLDLLTGRGVAPGSRAATATENSPKPVIETVVALLQALLHGVDERVDSAGGAGLGTRASFGDRLEECGCS